MAVPTFCGNLFQCVVMHGGNRCTCFICFKSPTIRFHLPLHVYTRERKSFSISGFSTLHTTSTMPSFNMPPLPTHPKSTSSDVTFLHLFDLQGFGGCLGNVPDSIVPPSSPPSEKYSLSSIFTWSANSIQKVVSPGCICRAVPYWQFDFSFLFK